MAKKKSSKQVKKKWFAGIDWGLVATLLAVPISVIALFQSCNSNKIAKSIYPSVTVTSSASFPIRNTQVEGYVTVVCRRQIRVANTGSSGTSIISLEPTGDFGEGGYLPTFDRPFLEFDFLGTRFVRPFIFFPPIPIIPFVLEHLKGPIPYTLTVSTSEEVEAMPTEFMKEDNVPGEPQSFDFGELARWLRAEPRLSSWADAFLGDQPSVFEPEGLPLYVPGNSAQDIFIDFQFTVPVLADLRGFAARLYMEKNKIDPWVGYNLDFPDIPSIELERLPCSSSST